MNKSKLTPFPPSQVLPVKRDPEEATDLKEAVVMMGQTVELEPLGWLVGMVIPEGTATLEELELLVSSGA